MINPQLPERLLSDRRLLWGAMLLLPVAGGLLLSAGTPHLGLGFVWPFIFVPLLLGLDLALRTAPPSGEEKGEARRARWKGWGRVLLVCWAAGATFAVITGGWVTNTSHVYGHLPWPLAFGVTLLGYGTLQGLETFLLLGVPFALTWRRPLTSALFTTLWVTVLQLYLPRFLFWTYGQLMYPLAELVQFAGVLGSGGLNLLYLPLQFWLYGWLRARIAPGEIHPRLLRHGGAGLAVLFVAAYAYGAWNISRVDDLRKAEFSNPASNQGAADGDMRMVTVVGIQPNFTLGHLASNPALSHSVRHRNLRALLDDSSAALAGVERRPGVPVVVLWPESVYPRPYFYAPEMRQAVEQWVREQGVQLVLATSDLAADRLPDGRVERRYYGAAVHVDEHGAARETYHKITLIPFGEYIPLAEAFPAFRNLLVRMIPQISEFTPGRDYTTFAIGAVTHLAPLICFDASVENVARGMARAGARIGVVLANLAWFGKTSVSDQLAIYASFRAIENDMPLVFLSQNGESMLIDPAGRQHSPRTGQFEPGAVVADIRTTLGPSFYSRHGHLISLAFALALLASLAVMIRKK
ncbi:MAG: apolipoprotein N-acyltransferase [Deltaproteobacteria bacterium]|nr:apolipoprotein N-acyltransferase [Deltaproteobacteria bacterium]